MEKWLVRVLVGMFCLFAALFGLFFRRAALFVLLAACVAAAAAVLRPSAALYLRAVHAVRKRE